MFKKSLYIFRRDLRLDDNTALMASCAQSEQVIPCFIFDPRQCSDQNEFKSDNALQFLIESLKDLQNHISDRGGNLYIFYGKADEVVARLIKEEKVNAVYINEDYTPFSVKRDQAIADTCALYGSVLKSYHDLTMHRPGDVLKSDGKPYTIYTPFYKRARQEDVTQPQLCYAHNFYNKPMKMHNNLIMDKLLSKRNDQLAVHGGRSRGIKLLECLGELYSYKEDRDFPARGATSKLSAHHKFGTVSIRESFWAAVAELGPEHQFIRELYWREFFTHIGHHFPHVYGKCFYSQYDAINWDKNDKKFEAWCEGKTGFPIVDAGMRELNSTGYMHNRVRMITASFLIKDLHIDWRRGERYFAQTLVDYDPAVNNGNWQWAASTGCDAAPYFRIFNPWIQQSKFDNQCEYIKRWIPELRQLTNKEIHLLHKQPDALKGIEYPVSIVDHSIEKERALGLYKSIRK